MIATAHIAAEHGSFNRICQVASNCTRCKRLHGSLGQRESALQTAFRSIGSVVVAGLTRVTNTDRQTDRQTDTQTARRQHMTMRVANVGKRHALS